MNLPGTTIDVHKIDIKEFRHMLDTVFITGGLTLSQITQLGKLEGHDVQNWIKRGFCKPPKNKKYDKKQFCRLVTINLLKDSMSIPDIRALISYVNGILDDESDDIIPDDLLYCFFAYSVIADVDEQCDDDYLSGLCDDDRQRVITAIRIMKKAYLSSQFKSQADDLMRASGIK